MTQTRAAYLLESEILMHISGTPGSGKTTLLNKLADDHPEFAYRDLDSFLRWNEKGNRLIKRSQRIQKWVDSQKRPIIIGGNHVNDDGSPMYYLPLSIQRKYYLSTPPLKSALRANMRRRRWNKMDKVKPVSLLRQSKWIHQEWKQGKHDVKYFQKQGYVPKSYDQIRHEVAQLAQHHKVQDK